ncbi:MULTISPECIES: ABC transporter ATP-binding protein [Rhodococcus]|jgi:branched-chain amino acid transport system ATP-binding protein|uniref:ABC transporter ATP-binding protein n=1 Tax=Rhodococcus qingshengii JCM 15477 TaxID=1303681 RepID=A0AB38RNX4_RHOSG|nr:MULTISPECIES: ABC transporter ATP-binding protein [Rhodococcus]ANQ75882.1 ABC transporter ATP-binding protein [Rhodococcus sp. 008]KSU69312.1 ABC transporter ATP-binding protein [Rhodococcus qingshengii]MDA3635189.1 ABC transporter ATP-binding protein [Rhodococcus sp. C-2]UPU46465.1 ABC transporter ATP-binding protein [Rhodococcus qingshengii JCM 15477]SCC66768.1 amino acid/amide ABC transporter ATP-binding protein 2, HAAT family (TC 3.A.1.4.-) [Rhodococcus qingshengii]
MSLLEVQDLYANYGTADVLHGINLTVENGEVVVILGANGAGKTTTMRAISGMIQRRGRVMFDGNDISAASPDEVVRLGLAQVPQGRGTIADLTVEENLRAGAHVRTDKKGIVDDIARWFDTYPRLSERRKQKAGLLSGGEQQMLAVSRAMMSRPQLLLCDEPSLGLSPKLTQELFVSLAQISKEMSMAILLVEQNATLALGIADRGYLIEVGTIAASRPAAELAGDDAIRAAYLGY